MPPPSLIIEVVSSGKANRDEDYRYKYTEYAARGVSEYEDTLYEGDRQIQSTVITDLDLSAAQIFACETII